MASAYSPQRDGKTVDDLLQATGMTETSGRALLQREYVHAQFVDRRWRIHPAEFERAVQSYQTRGFVPPPEYERWKTVEKLSEDIGKLKFSIWRHLRLGYIPGVKIRAKGRGGRWLIEPAAYDAFVQRYREAHAHLQEWSTVAAYATVVGLSLQWVRELIRAGRIQADKISRIEAMLNTKDKHTYRIPPEEMERARQASQLIGIGKLLETVEVEGLRFSRGYFLYTVFPELGIGQKDGVTRQARVRPEDISRMLEYIAQNSQTVRRKRDAEQRDRLNRDVREMDLDTRVLACSPPSLDDDATLAQEQQLWLFVKQGNNQAFGQLVTTYQHYLHTQARRFGYGIDIKSKVARGITGLWAAIMNASSVGPKIRHYAKKYVRGHIINFTKEERGRAGTISLELPAGDDRTLGEKLGVM